MTTILNNRFRNGFHYHGNYARDDNCVMATHATAHLNREQTEITIHRDIKKEMIDVTNV